MRWRCCVWRLLAAGCWTLGRVSRAQGWIGVAKSVVQLASVPLVAGGGEDGINERTGMRTIPNARASAEVMGSVRGAVVVVGGAAVSECEEQQRRRRQQTGQALTRVAARARCEERAWGGSSSSARCCLLVLARERRMQQGWRKQQLRALVAAV